LNQAIALNQMFGEPYLHRGIAHWNLKSLDEAIADFNVAIDKGPEATEAYYYRGLCLQKKGKVEPAVEDYLKAIALAPAHVAARCRLGELYLNQQKFAPALEEFDKILVLDPNTYWAYYWKALINDKLKNYPAAINFYRSFLEKAPQEDTNHKLFANQRIKQLTKWIAKYN
jgi:tetratricopeptide (TPR) repeat protein